MADNDSISLRETGEFNIPLKKLKIGFLLGQLLVRGKFLPMELNLLIVALSLGGAFAAQLLIGTWATVAWFIVLVLVCLLASGRLHRWARKLNK